MNNKVIFQTIGNDSDAAIGNNSVRNKFHTALNISDKRLEKILDDKFEKLLKQFRVENEGDFLSRSSGEKNPCNFDGAYMAYTYGTDNRGYTRYLIEAVFHGGGKDNVEYFLAERKGRDSYSFQSIPSEDIEEKKIGNRRLINITSCET